MTFTTGEQLLMDLGALILGAGLTALYLALKDMREDRIRDEVKRRNTLPKVTRP